MLTWFSVNAGNIIVILILAAAVFFAVRTIIRDKRQGRSGCGCQCGGCAMSGTCHNHQHKKQRRQAHTGR